MKKIIRDVIFFLLGLVIGVKLFLHSNLKVIYLHLPAQPPEIWKHFIPTNEDSLLSQVANGTITVQRIKVKLTAYSNDENSINVPKWRDGLTATMKKAKYGICASDWTLFPPGTKFFIPGYGFCTVEDKGGAVKGFHLDLFIPSYKRCIKWGVKEKEVLLFK